MPIIMESSSSAESSRIPVRISFLRSNRHHTLLPISSRISLRRPIALRARTLTAAVRSQSAASNPSTMGSAANMEKVYMSRNPTAKSVLELASSSDGSLVCYDHFAFRTFGELRFPAKKLRALWFASPEIDCSGPSGGGGLPLPRIFISELLVEEMSLQCQETIRKYVKMSGNGNKYAALASTLGCLIWENPVNFDYQQLSRYLLCIIVLL